MLLPSDPRRRICWSASGSKEEKNMVEEHRLKEDVLEEGMTILTAKEAAEYLRVSMYP
jgi:hypothetical protein